MKFLLSSLLLASLCDLSSWSVSSTGMFVVTQSADVSVMEGETVNITCCCSRTFYRMRVTWLANQTEILDERRIINKTVAQEEAQCSTLVLTNITRKDSGIYFCRVTVEIPFFINIIGNGTVIKVMDGDHTKDTEGGNAALLAPMIIVLAVGTPVLLLGLVCVCTLRRRQARAARVIYEAPHTDSEVADMDSTQWCQVPVYESIDYFEHTERKESE
ncbi:hypothetical protein PAMA_014087 [Pampus argenteus]